MTNEQKATPNELKVWEYLFRHYAEEALPESQLAKKIADEQEMDAKEVLGILDQISKQRLVGSEWAVNRDSPFGLTLRDVVFKSNK